MTVTEVSDGDLVRISVDFDPDDIDAAFAELAARWIASGEVAHPGVIQAALQLGEVYNRHDWDAMAAIEAGASYVNHRQLATVKPEAIEDHWLSIRTLGSLIPDMRLEQAEILTHSAIGLVSYVPVKGTTAEGTAIELPTITFLLFDDVRVTRMEAFDIGQREMALARFDELSRPAARLENAATRARARAADAFNRRDLNGFLALQDIGARYEDRRKGLRNEGPVDPAFARAVLFEAASGWQLEIEPVAVRGSHLALTRDKFRDTDEADRPIAVEVLGVTEVTDNGLFSHSVIFDPDDINGAMAELTSRWIASGEVAHPEVIEAYMQILQKLNRHDWDEYAASLADATHVNHRQLGTGETIVDFTTSVTMIASLIPNVWVEAAEILNAFGIGSRRRFSGEGHIVRGRRSRDPDGAARLV